MHKVISKLTGTLRDFYLFWNIRAPLAFCRIRAAAPKRKASEPKRRAAQDAALYVVSVAALVVIGATSY